MDGLETGEFVALVDWAQVASIGVDRGPEGLRLGEFGFLFCHDRWLNACLHSKFTIAGAWRYRGFSTYMYVS